jgi:hypothetical protein
MWANLREFTAVLDAEAARRLAAGAAATSACAALLLVIAVVHYSFGRRGSRVGGTLYALTIGAALGLPLAARGPGDVSEPPRRPAIVPSMFDEAISRVEIVLLDGASLDLIAEITAAGRLPHFARLLDEGASMHLSTIRPTQPAPVWAAVVTGMYPPDNGIRASHRYRFGVSDAEITLLPDLCLAHALSTLSLIEAVPNDTTALAARPLWSILTDAGISIGLTGVPLTYPAPRVDGYVISDRLHDATAVAGGGTHGLVFPAHWLGTIPHEAFDLSIDRPTAVRGQGPLARDVFYRRVAALFDTRRIPRVRAIRYEGIDLAGHHSLRYAMPGEFGDVTPAERERFGSVLEQQYALIDEEIGAAMQRLRSGDLLLVVSGFGMEPQSPGKRLLTRLLGEPDLSGTHERAPDGFLVTWGSAVTPGRLGVGSIVDVTPTLLYYLGLPVARDMDGAARTDIFARWFTADRPVTFIPTYGPD